MLELADVHSFYGHAHVVQGASLTVARGGVVALLGRNGMGKTTTIRSIMGLSPPTVRSGAILWDGESLRGLRAHEIAARRIAIVPQGRRLFPSLSVTEHLTMLASARRTVGRATGVRLFPRSRNAAIMAADNCLAAERAMLAIARALMIDPSILMDEPSEDSAPGHGSASRTDPARPQRERLSILLVEQNLYSALATADRFTSGDRQNCARNQGGGSICTAGLLLRHLVQ